MTNYRRYYVPGGSYFFTVALVDRRSDALVRHVDHLRAAFRVVMRDFPFEMPAVVIMPDHLHCIWTLPQGDTAYPQRWRRIKAGFSRCVGDLLPPSASRISKGELGVWQRRYWEHALRDEQDFSRHVDYIHRNPLKHGLVSCVADWPLSSFHRYVAAGIYPPDWCGVDEGELRCAAWIE